MNHVGRQRILILGAGFAGVAVAQELARLAPHESCEITLLDQNNYFLFTPMLTEVVGGQVDTTHIAVAIRRISPRVRYMQARVVSIDLEQKRVRAVAGGLANDLPETELTLEADQLVLALGSVTNYHHIASLERYSFSVKSLADAADIRNRALALLDRADAESDPEKRRELLTFVVAGGGYSGVETIAALNDLVREVARRLNTVRESDVSTILVHPEHRILPELSNDLAQFATKALRERGVDIKLNMRVKGAGEDYVELENGERIKTHLLVWAGGVTPSPVVAALDVPKGRHHGIRVDATCAVPGHPGVWALGDCAEIPHPNGKGTYAPIAQNATREGKRVAQNIFASMQGKQPRPFRYTPVGELALVGKGTGVASIYGFHISGRLAWAMWRIIYLAKEPSMAKRIRVGLDWLLDAAFGLQIVELPTQRQLGMIHEPQSEQPAQAR